MAKRKAKRKTKNYYKKRAIAKFIPYLLLIFVIPSEEKVYAEVMRQSGDFILAGIMDVLAIAVIIGLIWDWIYDLKKSL